MESPRPEPHFVENMAAEAKRLAAGAGMTLPELMREMETEEVAACPVRDCWRCLSSVDVTLAPAQCPHCGADNPLGEPQEH